MSTWEITEPTQWSGWVAHRAGGGANVRVFGPRAWAKSRVDLLVVLDVVDRDALETEMLPEGSRFVPTVARWLDGKLPPFYEGGVLGAQWPEYVEPPEDQIEGERDSPGVD